VAGGVLIRDRSRSAAALLRRAGLALIMRTFISPRGAYLAISFALCAIRVPQPCIASGFPLFQALAVQAWRFDAGVCRVNSL